jgi:hypothetical protein
MKLRTLRQTCLKLRATKDDVADYGDWFVVYSYDNDSDIVRLANYAALRQEARDFGEGHIEPEMALGGHALLIAPDAVHTKASVEEKLPVAQEDRIINQEIYLRLRDEMATDAWQRMPIHRRIDACWGTKVHPAEGVLPDMPAHATVPLMKRVLDHLRSLLG